MKIPDNKSPASDPDQMAIPMPAREDITALIEARDSAIRAAQNAVFNTTRLTRLMTILSEPTPLPLLLDRFLSALSELFSSDLVVLFDPVGTGSFIPIASIGLPEDIAANPFLDSEGGSISKVMNDHAPICIPIVNDYTNINPPLKSMEVKSVAWLPVFGNANPRGALLLARCSLPPFSDSDIAFLSTIANRIGLILERSQHTNQIEQIERISREINRHLDQSQISKVIVENYHPIIGADASILVFKQSDGEKWNISQVGFDLLHPDQWVTLTDQYLGIFSRDNRNPVYIAANEISNLMIAKDIQTILAIPIMFGDAEHPSGVLYALRHVNVQYDDETLKIAYLFAGQADTALENARLYHDIHEELIKRKRAEEALAILAYQDELTGLANRAYFLKQLDGALRRASRVTEAVALIYIDLDNFKIINDSLGHETGDEVLRTVSKRISDCLREDDIAARLGGDEFTVLIENVKSREQIQSIANRILISLQKPIYIGKRQLFINCSLGIAFSPSDEFDPETFLRNADLAMYSAKGNGKGRYEIYDGIMNEKAVERLELETELRKALQNKEFSVFYQPVISLDTNQMVQVEALIRWHHPYRGLISPSEIIPIAEETGLINEIGRFVLTSSCNQLEIWKRAVPLPHPVAISVNLSVKQMLFPGLVDDIKNILDSSGIDPFDMIIEITENSLELDAESVSERIHYLKNLGLRLAIDDFGVGYANLNYLKRLPIDFLKMDRSFTSGLLDNSRDKAIIQNMINLGIAFGFGVIAEGIETRDQSNLLQSMGCKFGQGYLFSPPVPADKLNNELIRNNSHGLDEER